MIPTQEKAEGNDDVVELFENALVLAKEGRLISAALVAVERDGMLLRAMAGTPGMEMQIYYGLERVQDHVKQLIIEREQRPPQTRATADFVCWNLRDMAHSYDFLCALISAEMARIREGAPAPLKFCFNGQAARPTEYTSQFYNGVMVPALSLIGAVIDPRALNGRSLSGHEIDIIVAAAKNGEKVPRFTPSVHAIAAEKKYAGWVTLTLREAKHWPHRNSNVPEWIKLADYLTKQGERIVFIRDTAMAHEPIRGHESHPLAALNLHTRAALYENAKCNLFSSNGPFGLALFGTQPWLCFQYFDENDLYEPNRPSWWLKHYNMPAGSQFPWSTWQQRLINGRDTFEVMQAAWDSLMSHKYKAWEQPIIGEAG